MFLTAICPTFRHPTLLANLLWCWEQQTHPANERHLLIFDDGGTFDDQRGPNWELRSFADRFSSLPAKYNALLATVPPQTEAVAVLDDDDIYLSGYVAAHARVLERFVLSKPSHVLSDYELGKVVCERGDGRFGSSMAWRKEFSDRVGGWPETREATFDQQFIRKLVSACGWSDSPWGESGPHQYVYSWHTGAAHGQHAMGMSSDWYELCETVYRPVPYVGKLIARQDERCKKILAMIPKP